MFNQGKKKKYLRQNKDNSNYQFLLYDEVHKETIIDTLVTTAVTN